MIEIKGTSGFRSVSEHTWDEVRADFQDVNQDFAAIIDDIAPGKDLTLFKVRYSFADQIISDGKFTLLEDLTHSDISASQAECQKVIDALDYSLVPLGLVTHNASEVYFDGTVRTIPLIILSPGYTIGLYEALDNICGVKSSPLWNVTAGGRSLFMLPKINNSVGHQKLAKKYGISKPVPQSLTDQGGVFADIVNADPAGNDWYNEIIFFSKDWLEHINDDAIGWVKLREYLFRECWRQTGVVIEKTFALIWQQFSSSTALRRFKPRIYVTDTIRHLVSLVTGFVPGFVASTESELLAPVDVIKSAYINVYELKNYLPTLMMPATLSREHPTVYYSLGYPTLLEGHPEISNTRNTVVNLREIKQLMDNMYSFCQKRLSGVEKFDDFIRNVQFDYFHKILDSCNEISDASSLIDIDSAFQENYGDNKDREFCSTGPFLNGCIKISRSYD
ncbi:MAG: hypothetical protein KAS93_03965 [Gammaproteobacteria bacterium]|nr:hypothetical protein [Gammaproteobacteria bacterium]